MSIETMITEAVLRDRFTPVLRKMAEEQDDFARKSSRINTLGNVFTLLGAGALAFTVKATKVAGTFDQIRKSMTATVGAQQAAFDTKYVDEFAQHSTQTYLALEQAAGKLDAQHVSVSAHLKDMADIAAGSGASISELSQIYDRLLAGGKTGTALGQQGFPRFGFSTKEIFEAAGLPYRPGQKVQGMITPEQADAAIHALIQKKGWAGLDEKMATSSLRGASGMLEDSISRFEKNVGDANLGATIKSLNLLARSINAVATAIGNHPRLALGGELLGGGALVAGGVLKGMKAWRDYHSILDGVKKIAKEERQGEVDKVGVAAQEATALVKSGGAYKLAAGEVENLTHKGTALDRFTFGLRQRLPGLTDKMIGLGRATMTAGGEAMSAGELFAAGGVALGAYAAIAVGAVADIYAVVGALKALGDASENVEKAQAANRDAIKQGYDVKQSHVTGAGSKSVWKQYLYDLSQTPLVNPLIGAGIKSLWGKDFDAPTSFTALTDAHTRALAKKHGMPKGGVRARQIAAEQAARDKAAHEAREAAGDAANKYELDPALNYKLGQDERRVELLEAQKAGMDKINAARKTEIADLEKAARLFREQAKLATDPNAKYKLLDEADQADQKAKLLALDKKKEKGGFDKTIAQILGAGGLSEEDILKRTGIGRKFFAGSGKAHAPADPIKSAIAHLSKRPLLVNLHMGDKKFAEFKSELKDETLHDILTYMMRMEQGSHGGQVLHTK